MITPLSKLLLHTAINSSRVEKARRFHFQPREFKSEIS